MEIDIHEAAADLPRLAFDGKEVTLTVDGKQKARLGPPPVQGELLMTWNEDDLAPVLIHDRGRGPEVVGTRITIYTVWEYAKGGASPEQIAEWTTLTPRQAKAAMACRELHREEVGREYAKIMERINRGNPPWVEEICKRSREKFRRMVAEPRGNVQDRAS